MSERETQIQTSFERWRGVDQRTQPTLVQTGFFSSVRGVYFASQSNAQRIPGKVPVFKLNDAVLGIIAMGTTVFVQCLDTLRITDLASLQIPPEVNLPILDEGSNDILDENGLQILDDA